MDLEVLTTGKYCKDCGYFEEDAEFTDEGERSTCKSCGCHKDFHVDAQVVTVYAPN